MGKALHKPSDRRAHAASVEGYVALALVALGYLLPSVGHPTNGMVVIGAVSTGITFGLALGGARFGKGGGEVAAWVALVLLSLLFLLVLASSVARWDQIQAYWRR